VQRTTGRGLAAWQDDTGPPLLPLSNANAYLIPGDRDWLAPRIARRFDAMLDAGVLGEARANRPGWSPALPSAKAIGAAELMAHLDGALPLDAAREAIVTLTRQYAKRQRTWFRARMSAWVPVHPD
jgi:tRNA dimethylallyltransferase